MSLLEIFMVFIQPSQQGAISRRVENIFTALNREHVVVGKKRLRSWHAWLIIGLAVGIVSGVLIVANRSGEVNLSSANGDVTIFRGALSANKPAQSFTLSLTKTGTLTTELYFSSYASSMTLDVYDPDGSRVSHRSGISPIVFSTPINRLGTYKIVVLGYSGIRPAPFAATIVY